MRIHRQVCEANLGSARRVTSLAQVAVKSEISFKHGSNRAFSFFSINLNNLDASNQNQIQHLLLFLHK